MHILRSTNTQRVHMQNSTSPYVMEILHACFLQMKFPSFKCTALEGIMYCDEIAKGFCCYNEGQYAVGHFVSLFRLIRAAR